MKYNLQKYSESLCCIPETSLIYKLTILNFFLFFSFIFISWRLITLQYCSGFCHSLT